MPLPPARSLHADCGWSEHLRTTSGDHRPQSRPSHSVRIQCWMGTVFTETSPEEALTTRSASRRRCERSRAHIGCSAYRP
eukprot:8669177-Pyramimonas_sp.AAC.1